jgi:hypothetical protein
MFPSPSLGPPLLSLSPSPPSPCGIPLFMGGGLEWVVVGGGGGGLEWVVIGGGGAACVVIVSVVPGGGGGGAVVCVVIISVVAGGGGVGAAVCVAAAVAAALWDGVRCAAALAWARCACLWAGFAAGGGVVAGGVAVVAGGVGVVAAALAAVWVEVEDDDPQALASSVTTTANAGMRRCFMVVSLPPGSGVCQRTPGGAICFPRARERS